MYAYVFENIKSVQLEALFLSLLSIVVLVLAKELNEKFKRKIKVVLPVDLILVSMKSTFSIWPYVCQLQTGMPRFTILSRVTDSYSDLSIKEG